VTGRRSVHLRRIHCEGFVRDDGLYELEGTLIDTKPTPLQLPEKPVAAGEAIHHMVLTLTIDADRLIHDASARTVQSPYASCAEVQDAYRQLVGCASNPASTTVPGACSAASPAVRT